MFLFDFFFFFFSSLDYRQESINQTKYKQEWGFWRRRGDDGGLKNDGGLRVRIGGKEERGEEERERERERKRRKERIGL